VAGEGATPALRGRSKECEALESVLRDARDSQSRVLVVRGEAGIGKTAVLRHVRDLASDFRLAGTVGVESETQLAHAGLHQICAPLLGGIEDLPAPQATALRTTFGLTAGPPPDALLLGLATLGLLSIAAERQPLLCLVDDAQWLDAPTVSTLGFVARRLGAEPVAVVFGVRDPLGAAALDGLPTMRIEGIGDADARAVLDSATMLPLEPRVRDRVVAEARGNPLALLELPRAQTVAELEMGFGSNDATAVPTRVEQEFQRQIQELPDDTRRLLLTAAVEPLGDVPLLWRAADHLGIDADAAAPAEEAELIDLGARVRFRHPLIRSAVYRQAAVSEVRAAHHALARATDPLVDPDRRVWHLAHAVGDPDEDVAQQLEVAYERARDRGALLTAAALLERSTALTPDPATRGQRAIDAARAKAFSGQVQAGLELLATAELCPLDPLQQAWALRMRATFMSLSGEIADSARLFLDAGELSAPSDAPTARGAYVNALGLQVLIGRLDGEGRLAAFATASQAAPPAPDPPRPIDAVLDALTARFTGGHAAGLEPARQALRTCSDERDYPDQFLQWLWFAPPLAPDIWDDELWDRVTATVLQRNRELGAMNTMPMALQYRAEFLLHAGELTAATTLLDESDTIVDMAGRPDLGHYGPVFAAWCGDPSTPQLAEAAIAAMSTLGTGRAVALGEYAKALFHNGVGRYDQALAAARRAADFDDLGLHGLCLIEVVEAASRSGADTDAARALRRLEAQALDAGTDWALGALAQARATAGQDETEGHHREAVERLGRTRMTAHLARAHLGYGEWLRREQRRVDAREQLRIAYELLDAMGAAAFAERARRELMATGEKVRRRSVETAGTLTSQEAQIARLAAEGATNPEIGTRLFISPRTVEYHLSKVFTKLGLSSRRELRTALR
jgi:DNA-binding CsgD family transcriptional regulator